MSASDARDEVFAVLSGLIQIDRQLGNGDRSVRVAGPGEVAGEEGLVYGSSIQRIQALTTAVILAVKLKDVDSNLGVCKWLLHQLTEQLRQTDREILWLRTHSVENRVQLHLLSLHEKGGGVEIPISQADFAQMVGATRESTSMALNRLARAELIRLSRRSITVLQPENLGIGLV